jgi:Fe-Mn family superoxide dismutase
MNPHHLLTRRAALKSLGVGAALIGLGLRSSQAAITTVAETVTVQPFTLPPLAYAYDALEPHFDAQTMEIHHRRHHQAYINNANQALVAHPELQGLSAEALVQKLSMVPESVRTALRNNVGGHLNHTLFWRVLSPNGGGEPPGELGAAIAAEFGSFKRFKDVFTAAALGCFGSGWAWLSLRAGALMVHPTANQDSPLMEGAIPLLGLDVWEHAYYLRYQNRRADFVGAFWRVVNWDQVAADYATARMK